MMRQNNRIEAIIPVSTSELICGDFESFLDMLSELTTGSKSLMNIEYEAVAILDAHHIAFKVVGDASDVIDMEEDEFKDRLFDELVGLFDFEDGYTPEDAAQFTIEVSNVLRTSFNLPIRLVMDWGQGEPQLLALVSDEECKEAAHEVTMPYNHFDDTAGEINPLEQFIDDILTLI